MSGLNCLKKLYSLSKTCKLKTWQVKFKPFNSSWIMAFIDTAIIIYLTEKVKSSGILTCSLSCLIFIFFFWGLYICLSPLIFLLGLFTLFLVFCYFSFFQNMGKQIAESKVCTYFTRLSKVNSKLWILYLLDPNSGFTWGWNFLVKCQEL